MRKVLCLLLALVMCLSLLACSGNSSNSNKEENQEVNNSKYIGTYTTQKQFMDLSGMKFQTSTEMVLSADGTGTYVMKATTANSLMYGKYNVAEGDVLLSYDLQWEESGDYLVINGSGKQYYELTNTNISAMISEGKAVTISESYELKGNKLINVNDTAGYAAYTKTN